MALHFAASPIIGEDDRKLAELILYVSQRCANDGYFGQTKLQKILFFADFTAYGKWGTTISGAEYQHLPFGPGVRRMLPVQDALKAEKAFAIQPTDCYGSWQKKPVNLREPDLCLFDGKEISLLDAIIERFRSMSGAEASQFSHETAGWNLTEESETIDPKTVFLSWGKPTAYEMQRGLVLAEQYGLLA